MSPTSDDDGDVRSDFNAARGILIGVALSLAGWCVLAWLATWALSWWAGT